MSASFIKSGTNRKTMKRSWPSVYLTGGKHFNLTAILQSGEFYLDEAGLLVAPNGTRYRIPSGPPEGRKPLRVDRPRQNVTVESEKSRADPILNPLGDSYSVEQEDFSKFAHVNPAQKQNPTNWSKYSNRQMIGTTFRLPAHSASWPLTTSSPNSGNDFLAIDWNIVLLTIVLSSVALICNLGLVFLLSWRLRQMRKRTMNINGEMGWGAGEDMQNYKCYVPNLQESSEDDWMNRTERDGRQIRINVNSQKQFNDRLVSSRINDRFQYANFPSRRQRYHRRHYSRRGRMRGRLKYATNTYGGASRFSEQEYNDPPTIRRRVHEFDDQAERRSNSIRSFQGVVVSDGVLSETTGDDEDSTTESGNNSDVPVHSRRRYSGGRPHSQVPPLRGWHYRSDSTPDEVDRVDSYSSDSQTRKPDLSARSRPSYLGTIRSVERQSFSNNNDETYFLDKSFDTSTASKLPPFNIRLCHTLGIHLGLLGTVLSLVQIVTLCSALNSRFQSGGDKKDLQLSEFVCILSTSLAADTILCARLYLHAAFLFVFWTTLYMAVISRTGRLKEHSFPALCFALTASREHVTNHKSCEQPQTTHSPSKQSVNESQTGSRRQQRYAYLALMHSLPWAISAGTALLITFALYNTVADLNTFSENGRNERSQVKLNLFFKGLDSLLVCTMDASHRAGYRTKFSGNSQKTTYSPITSTRVISSDKSLPESWISAFLLVLIPLMLHLLICFVCSVLLRANFTHQSGSKSVHRKTDKQICGSLCSIFFLILTESLSCGLPVIWAMTNPYDSFSRDSRSMLIYRLIIAHLFIDPWVVAWMLHSIMHHITPSLPHNGSMSQFLQRNRANSLNSVENLVFKNDEDPLKSRISLKEKPSSASRPSISPGTFMSCVPVCERASSQSNEEVLEAPVSHHPMFMSCMPGAGLYLPSISQLPPSPLEANNNGRPAIGTTGFLVPITNVSMAISVSGPGNSTILKMQPSNPNIFNNRGAGASPPSMGTDTSTPSRSLGSGGHHPLHEVFPQLCEHHQQLLEQHFKPKPPKQASEELRKFGLVPRLNQPTVSFTDSLIMMAPLSKTSDPEKTVNNDAASESRAELKTVATVEGDHGLDEPLKLTATHRPLSGKSPATAAVMAAAAAAVAAQAGNMSRTMEENPQHGTSGKSNNE
ncbi:unnamed protein product [Calicophoron daubneyi]|uniref:Uncharacterized protein n=1 Tax=Calicophoron daubneyi TaxID=300641 RepID=A0AAV2T4J6_CALDB